MAEPASGFDASALEQRAVNALRERLLGMADKLAPDHAVPESVSIQLDRIVRDVAPLLPDRERAELVDRVLFETVGMGVLEPLFRDAAVDEVMVNGSDAVYVERAGRIEKTAIRFESDEELANVIEKILAPLGRRLDEASPLVDARLSDGSRINCVIPPLSLLGPVLTVRRFRRRGFSMEELVGNGTLTAELVDFISACVRAGLNIVVSGGTGSGKTTTLNALSEHISEDERVITIEDAAELKLRQPHVIRLESRPPNVEGRGEVTIRDLVRNALRMRPDRIVVGEVRGGEALDMLQAMNTGHDGSLTTLHANSPLDAVRRIETMALMADVSLPHAAIQQQVASAIDLIVHQVRARSGQRFVSSVAEVERVAAGVGIHELYWLDGSCAQWNASVRDKIRRRVEIGDFLLREGPDGD